MRVCVIADYVAAVRDLLREGGKCAHTASNDEESRAHIVLVEQVEQFWRDGGIRAVVKGESD